MSFTVGVELACDNCNDWLGEHHTSKKNALVQAKLEGWKMIKGKHYCPSCIKKKLSNPIKDKANE